MTGEVFMLLWLVGVMALAFTPWALLYLLVLALLVVA